MPIWSTAVVQRPEDAPAILKADFDVVEPVGVMNCIYCANAMSLLTGERREQEEPVKRKYGDDRLFACRIVEACSRCGWWVATVRVSQLGGAFVDRWLRRSWGVLREMDLSDISVPLHELQTYLLARYSSRGAIHPRALEETVGSIFRSCGYHVRVTAYSGDHGIDLFVMDGQEGATIGVQVKRHKSRIEAEQIRAFAGALLLEDLTRGIYVTTSAFRSGATSVAREYAGRGLAIELWDAQRLYDALALAQRAPYSGVEDPTAPFYELWSYNRKDMPELVSTMERYTI